MFFALPPAGKSHKNGQPAVVTFCANNGAHIESRVINGVAGFAQTKTVL